MRNAPLMVSHIFTEAVFNMGKTGKIIVMLILIFIIGGITYAVMASPANRPVISDKDDSKAWV